jgi:hypothetical protein
MKQLGGMDASFLYLETAETPMHIGGLSLFELPEGYDGNFYEAAIKQTSRAVSKTKQAIATQMKKGLAAQTKKAGSTAKAVTVRARTRSRNEVSK